MVTVSKRAREVEGTRVYLEDGEKVPLRKLIQGLLINSGNDAGVAIAEHLDGSVESFATNLNDYLGRLGLKNTHFENPHGLFSPDHVTTAKDLAILTQYAMKNEDFREVFGTKELEWKGLSWETTLYTHHKLMREQPYEGVTGGKTGYVDQSGQTLITTAEKNDLSLIVVTLSAPTQQIIYRDTIELLDFGFDHYQTSLVPKGTFSLNDQQFLLTKDFYFTQALKENVTTKMNENGILEVINQNQEVIASTQLEGVRNKKSNSNKKEKITVKKNDSKFLTGRYVNTLLFILFFAIIVLFTRAIVRQKRGRKFKRKQIGVERKGIG